jgi:S-adenosylmethionine:tRNA ribosyltransferase-isomerase
VIPAAFTSTTAHASTTVTATSSTPRASTGGATRDAGHRPQQERAPMKPAQRPRSDDREDRLLVADSKSGVVVERRFIELPEILAPGDLVIVNDAATRPSSLQLSTSAGADVELRILDHHSEDNTYGVVVFGAGDWHDDTDHRPAPPALAVGEVLTRRGERDPAASVVAVSDVSPRNVRVQVIEAVRDAMFGADTRVDGEGAVAHPVQYSYMARALTLAEVQTPYASRPWASEMPSAGRALSTSILVALKRNGVDVARVTAAASLSATGDPALDRKLPLPERYEIPQATVDAIARTRARGGRIIAIGTSTVRALESSLTEHGAIRAGQATATLVLGPETPVKSVDGIVSGMHEAATSHDSLLRAFADESVIDDVIALGRERGLFIHELGDHCLIAPGVVSARVQTSAGG